MNETQAPNNKNQKEKQKNKKKYLKKKEKKEKEMYSYDSSNPDKQKLLNIAKYINQRSKKYLNYLKIKKNFGFKFDSFWKEVTLFIDEELSRFVCEYFSIFADHYTFDTKYFKDNKCFIELKEEYKIKYKPFINFDDYTVDSRIINVEIIVEEVLKNFNYENLYKIFDENINIFDFSNSYNEKIGVSIRLPDLQYPTGDLPIPICDILYNIKELLVEKTIYKIMKEIILEIPTNIGS